MGKKSKRTRSKNGDDAPSPADNEEVRSPPNQRKAEEETIENLRFEDPFADEIEEEEEYMDDDEYNEDEGGDTEYVQSWHPLMEGDPQDLEMDPTAYKMHHSLTPDWPALSFDFLRDDLGESRQRFPHTLWAAVGTQADTPENNHLTILQLADLAKIPQPESEDDILGEEIDKKKDGDDDDDDDDSSDEEIDMDPVVEHYRLTHYGGVNRVRSMPQQPHIIATWSDVGNVNLYNVKSILSRFSASNGGKQQQHSANNEEGGDNNNKPFFTHSSTAEGYAMDWSTKQEGSLVTGNCNGTVSLWKPNSGSSSYDVTDSYEVKVDDKSTSVEDLQWSPAEATVFAAATCEGTVQIFDTRAPNRAMLYHKIHSCDVNVLSWNRLVTNLLATGADDGTISVWDLRHFGGKSSSTTELPTPLARFTAHKTPITSVEWHPTDESMLGVTDDVGAYVYDLSVEEDHVASSNIAVADIPPQLLFCHAGSRLFKEVHWHPQIPSCMMTTALTGFSVFIPSNL